MPPVTMAISQKSPTRIGYYLVNKMNAELIRMAISIGNSSLRQAAVRPSQNHWVCTYERSYFHNRFITISRLVLIDIVPYIDALNLIAMASNQRYLNVLLLSLISCCVHN